MGVHHGHGGSDSLPPAPSISTTLPSQVLRAVLVHTEAARETFISHPQVNQTALMVSVLFATVMGQKIPQESR